MRLEERDTTALFVFLDDSTFNGERLKLSPDYLFFRMDRRTPTLPPWVVVGVANVFGGMTFREDNMMVLPLQWTSSQTTLELQQDPEAFRTLLPMAELLAFEGPGAVDKNSRRFRTWRAQAVLFFRWALDGGDASRRTAFWKLAARATVEPMTETLFQECFGFDFSDMRDQLSDYLPIAVKRPINLSIGRLAKPARFEVRLASDVEISRLKGEWERLEIPYVKATHPEFADQYIEQARRTLRRAANKEGDPRLLALLGLCEIDAGNDAGAIPFLEAAVAAKVVRPKAYFELARLRYRKLTATADAQTKKLTTSEIEHVLTPLRIGWNQAPPLPEIAALLAQTWLRCADTPPEKDLALLREAARLFPRQPGLAYGAALLHMNSARPSEAAALVAQGLRAGPEGLNRERLVKLQAALAENGQTKSGPILPGAIK